MQTDRAESIWSLVQDVAPALTGLIGVWLGVWLEGRRSNAESNRLARAEAVATLRRTYAEWFTAMIGVASADRTFRQALQNPRYRDDAAEMKGLAAAAHAALDRANAGLTALILLEPNDGLAAEVSSLAQVVHGLVYHGEIEDEAIYLARSAEFLRRIEGFIRGVRHNHPLIGHKQRA